MAQDTYSHIPIIDISALVSGKEDRHEVAAKIGQACRDCGFFYIVGHGVDEPLQRRMEKVSQEFFVQDLETKLEIAMSRGVEPGEDTSLSVANSHPGSLTSKRGSTLVLSFKMITLL